MGSSEENYDLGACIRGGFHFFPRGNKQVLLLCSLRPDGLDIPHITPLPLLVAMFGKRGQRGEEGEQGQC